MEYLFVRNKMPLLGSILHFLKERDDEKGIQIANLLQKMDLISIYLCLKVAMTQNP